MTVLFADVVRSMDLATAVDVERLREIMTGLVSRAGAVVQRYGAGSVEYTGDGVMALFGAPMALEDHAFRACLAALALQQEAGELAEAVANRDGVTLRLRVGLNSGEVIAGEIESGGYRATGETVGMAQRMESAAPPGGVLVSESTARLVEHTVVLGEPQSIPIKGVDGPVCARPLVGIGPAQAQLGRVEAHLVGRGWELAALQAMIDRAIAGRGAVVHLAGPPGIGKSRMAREVAAIAAGRGAAVVWAFCESHAGDIAFHLVSRLLRAGSGVTGLDGDAARARLRQWVPADTDPRDVALLDDLLGIADPQAPAIAIAPDARRRRLTALVNAVSLARREPALVIIEDAHWIDATSESMIADFLAVVERTPSLVLITSRPEYRGSLASVPGTQTITFGGLGDAEVSALLAELLGPDPSVAGLTAVIVERAAGNPFFAVEMVRELVQRGVLSGERGAHTCHTDVAELSVPVTVQAAIEARIDRLSAPAKRTLNAASVIGVRFDADLLAAVGIDAVLDELLDELLDAELIDQVQFPPHPEYGFHHPLIRAVAYESQLRSSRAELHRRLAATIEATAPTDDNAALIAEHLESAGDLHPAYTWHMRAGTWSVDRDVGAARLSWRRAQHIADQLPPGPDHLPLRIAPRTMLCATGWQAVQDTRVSFEDLRELCTAAGDKVSLVIGMTGLATELLYASRPGEGSRLASEQMALLESIGDPNLTIGLAFVAFANWFNSGEFGEILRWSQTVIELADGDPAKGAGFGLGSPLAVALAFRGVARWWLGLPGWDHDLRDAATIARHGDPTSLALVIAWAYGLELLYGVLRADDATLHTIEEAVRTLQRASNDFALMGAEYALGTALLERDAASERRRGLEIMERARAMWQQRAPSLVPITEVCAARERARSGERDAAIVVIRKAVDKLHEEGRLGWAVGAAGILVQSLLERGAAGDLAEAQRQIDWLAALRPDQDWAIREVTLLRLRALLAHAHGDDTGYREAAHRYRALAESLGFQGHTDWAEAMTEGRPAT